MKLGHLEQGKLVPCPLNMRHGRKPPDVANILPSVKKRGVIVPLLVRSAAGGDPDRVEIVAGLRRWAANGIALAEGIDHGPLPVAFLEDGDDADAIEASLIENTARLDPDEVTQWETFVRLVKEGRGIDDISATFGIPEQGVKRILALGNLLPRIRDLYRRQEIDAVTVRHLTMASKSQQKAWLALLDDGQAYVPTGHQLKAWLLGGQSVPVGHALFDLAAYPGATVADLFGEDRYFADADQFWTAQEAAVEAKRADYLEAGWPDVVVLGAGEHFHIWEYEKAPKRKGGRVYIDVRSSGEVIFHEGYLTRKEAQRLRKGEIGDPAASKPARPEITSTMRTYIDLHRHAAVRAALVGHPKVALRLMVAHAVAGSYLWSVKVESQACRNEAVQESVETCRGEADFDRARRLMLDRLGFSPEEPTVVGGDGGLAGDRLAAIFLRLLGLTDRAVMDLIAVVMGETLASGSAAVEAVGSRIGVDMARYWQADDAFFDLVRDKEVLVRLVAEVAGEAVARANAKEKGKALKRIIRDQLDGANGREKRETWVPRWMAFPPCAYTGRGGVATVDAAARVAAARPAGDEPEPTGPGALVALPAPEPEPEIAPLAA